MAFLSPPQAAASLQPGSYHTDGSRLLHVLPLQAEPALLALEDCLTLEVMLIPVSEVAAMGLQPVADTPPGLEKLE